MKPAPIEVHGYDDQRLVVGARVLIHPGSAWRARYSYATITRIHAPKTGGVAVIIEPEDSGRLAIRIRPQEIRQA